MPYEQDMRKAKRQQMLAQMLMQQGLAQGQMVGNQFVAPSKFASIAGALQQLVGVYALAKADDKIGSLEEQRKKQLAEKLAEMAGGSTGAAPSIAPTGPAAPMASGISQPAPDPRQKQMAAALSMIGEMPLEQQEQLVSSQAMQKLFPKQDPRSLFGQVSPSDFTPESLREFQASGDYGVLKPKGGGQNIGNFNPGDYTPESFGKFMQSGDVSALQRYVTPANPSVQIIGGVPTVVQPSRTGAQPTQAPLSTLDTEAKAKADLAAAEAGAKTTATAEAEKEINAPKRAEKARQITTSIDSTVMEVDKALKGIDWSTTGLFGSIAKAVPGTDAYNLGQTLLTVKANIGFDRLQAMRDASPTGGALGQVAVQELNALQASVASLDQAQDSAQLKDSLEKVKQHYNGWKEAVQKAGSQDDATNGTPKINSDEDFDALPSGAEFIDPEGKRRRKP